MQSWIKTDAKADINLLSPPLNSYRNMSAMNGTTFDNNVLNSVLIGDTFLIDRMSPSFFVNPLTDSVENSAGSNIDDDIMNMNMMETNMDVPKPFDSFDDQIIMAPPPPPPLEDAFIDDGLLHLNDSLVVDRDLDMNYEAPTQIGFSPPSLVPGLSDNQELFECNLFGNNAQSDQILLNAWTDQMT